MISLKSKREIEIMQNAGNILKEVFRKVKPVIEPGLSTEDLDRIAEATIRKEGGEPAFKGYRGYPKTACISVNEEVVHGIPGSKKLNLGDVVSFDIGVRYQGYYADAARTWSVGPVSSKIQHLVETARKSLEAGLSAYRADCRIGDLSAAIQKYIESQGYQVVGIM